MLRCMLAAGARSGVRCIGNSAQMAAARSSGCVRSYASTTIKRVRGKSDATWTYPLFVIPLVTFGLGTWQVQRLGEKRELLDKVLSRAFGDPIPLPQSPEICQHMTYQRVSVDGTFLNDKEMHVIPRPRRNENGEASGEYGAYVITPFKRADNGETILVNRGWVSWGVKNPQDRPEGQVEGKVHLVGILRNGESGGKFIPENKPEKNEWYWLDLNTMADRTGAQPILVDAVAGMTPPCGFPVGGQTNVDIRNEHMQYIVTWYSLCALTSLYCYKLLKRKW